MNKIPDDERLLRSIKKFKIVTIFLIVLVVGQNLINFLELPSRFWSVATWYLPQEDKKFLDLEEKFNRLGIGVPIPYVKSLFGEAKFVESYYNFCNLNSNFSFQGECSSKSKSRLYSYGDNDYAINFVSDENDEKVLFYSISITNKDFKPKIDVYFGRFVKMSEIQLGKTRFGDLPKEGDETWLTAHHEGFVSGTGNDSYFKYFFSGDYASSNLYIFKTSVNRLQRDISYHNCPGIYNAIDGDIPAGEINDSTNAAKISDLESQCVITAIKIVPNQENITQEFMSSLMFTL